VEAPRREIVLPRAAYLVAALVLGGYIVYGLRDVLTPIFLAFSIAYILDPLVDWLEAWHVPRPAGIALVLGGTLGLVGLFLVLVLPRLGSNSAALPSRTPRPNGSRA
jgi:predicted PurR-regulated permease PerM